MGGTRALIYGEPYRYSTPPEEPFTDAEMVFWDAVYSGYIACKGDAAETATRVADEAVQIRRKKFGVR